MKRFMKNLMLIVAAAATVGMFGSCKDPVAQVEPNKPDPEPEKPAAIVGTLNCDAATAGTLYRIMTTGRNSATKQIELYYTTSRKADDAMTLNLKVDPELVATYNATNSTSFAALPADNYSFPDGTAFTVAKEADSSAALKIVVEAKTLAAGDYLLPVVADGADAEQTTTDGLVVYLTFTVRNPIAIEGNVTVNDPAEYCTILNVDCSKIQPNAVADLILYKTPSTDFIEFPFCAFGNFVNLRTATVGYDATAGRALLDLGTDLTYVLDHRTKYILPIQDPGRKVLLSIEGGEKGIGFCNFTDEQIEDFVGQVKGVIDTYELDGVNLFDVNSAYGTGGLPAVNTTSYPKLIKALREALGQELFINVVDYEEPTASFFDTAATGGIEVGKLIDYAYSGYGSQPKPIPLSIIDPWNKYPDYASKEYTRKPIAGLDESKYGNIYFRQLFGSERETVGENESMAAEDNVFNYFSDTSITTFTKVFVFHDHWIRQQDEMEGYGGHYVNGEWALYADGRDWSTTYQVINKSESGTGYGFYLKDW